jgi:hypothetical protein
MDRQHQPPFDKVADRHRLRWWKGWLAVGRHSRAVPFKGTACPAPVLGIFSAERKPEKQNPPERAGPAGMRLRPGFSR